MHYTIVQVALPVSDLARLFESRQSLLGVKGEVQDVSSGISE